MAPKDGFPRFWPGARDTAGPGSDFAICPARSTGCRRIGALSRWPCRESSKAPWIRQQDADPLDDEGLQTGRGKPLSTSRPGPPGDARPGDVITVALCLLDDRARGGGCDVTGRWTNGTSGNSNSRPRNVADLDMVDMTNFSRFPTEITVAGEKQLVTRHETG